MAFKDKSKSAHELVPRSPQRRYSGQRVEFGAHECRDEIKSGWEGRVVPSS